MYELPSPHFRPPANVAQFSVLSEPPPTLDGAPFAPIPFTRAVALDPWLEPLPRPGPTPHRVAAAGHATQEEQQQQEPQQGRAPPALLVLNSEGFTLWDTHFARLRDTVRAWDAAARRSTPDAQRQDSSESPGAGAALLTLVRAKHVSFSDFGVALPFGAAARDGRRLLDVICELADAFLGGGFDAALARQSAADGRVERVQGKKGEERRLVGGVGDVVVHALDGKGEGADGGEEGRDQ